MPVLYYVRHGETDYNVAGRLQGQLDTPLNARGRAQAQFCGRVLGDLFARARRRSEECAYVSSPLLRARETMQIMRATLKLDPADYSLDDRLKEVGFGAWEGFTLADILARDRHVLARRERDKWSFEPPGGESYRALARRVGAWYAGIARDTVVAAHAGNARALMVNLKILPEAEAAHAEIAHGTVYVFAGGTVARYA